MLDAARSRSFTGQLEFGTDPVASVFLERGEVYLAECEGDPPIDARLVAAGVLEIDELDIGSVEVAGLVHLGRLFDRVPWLDRAAVLVALEALSAETVAWVAAQTAGWVVSRPYVHHPSGVNRWYLTVPPTPAQLPAPLAPPVLSNRPVRGWRPPVVPPTPADEVRIEWLDDDPHREASPPSPQDADRSSADRSTAERPVVDRAAAVDAADDAPEQVFEVVWPSGVVEVALPSPTITAPFPPPDVQGGESASRLDGSIISTSFGTSTPDAAVGSEQLRMAVRRTIAAIESGLVRGHAIDPVVPVPDTAVDPFEQWRAPADPVSDDGGSTDPWATARTPGSSGRPDAVDEDVAEDPFGGWGLDRSGPPDVADGVLTSPGAQGSVTPRRGTLADRVGSVPQGSDGDDERQTALRRLIDGLRGR